MVRTLRAQVTLIQGVSHPGHCTLFARCPCQVSPGKDWRDTCSFQTRADHASRYGALGVTSARHQYHLEQPLGISTHEPQRRAVRSWTTWATICYGASPRSMTAQTA